MFGPGVFIIIVIIIIQSCDIENLEGGKKKKTPKK